MELRLNLKNEYFGKNFSRNFPQNVNVDLDEPTVDLIELTIPNEPGFDRKNFTQNHY